MYNFKGQIALLKIVMDEMGVQRKNGKSGQVMVEYMIVLLSVVLMYFLMKYVMKDAFLSYGGRALDFIKWKYP